VAQCNGEDIELVIARSQVWLLL